MCLQLNLLYTTDLVRTIMSFFTSSDVSIILVLCFILFNSRDSIIYVKSHFNKKI